MPNISAKGPDPGKRAIQSLVFSKEQWTQAKAEAWLVEHDFRLSAHEETEESHRFRQFNPSACDPDTYQTLTENFPAGVSAVSCEGAARSLRPVETGDSREVRVLSLEGSELRVIDADGERAARIAGRAVPYDSESLDLGFGREIVRRGAFAKTLQESDVVALWNHDPSYPLGRLSAGTLSLRDEERGLYFDTAVPTESPGPFFLESIRLGNVSGASFGFRAIKDRWSQDENGVSLRELLEVELFDVSPAAFPAYSQTDVFLRSLRAADGIDPAIVQTALEDEALTRPEIRARVEKAMGDWLPEPGRVTHSEAAGFLDRESRRLDLEDLES